jgi:lysylphosphatidylglycerol synthetase-like protein (DUF2156 family)
MNRTKPWQLHLALALLWTAFVLPSLALLLTATSLALGELRPESSDVIFAVSLFCYVGLVLAVGRGVRWARIALLGCGLVVLAITAFGPTLTSENAPVEGEIVVFEAVALAAALLCLFSEPVSRWMAVQGKDG